MKLVVVLLCMCVSLVVSAQDTLLLMNGHEMNCNILSDTGTVFVFEHTNKRGKLKVNEIHKNDVFSVTKRGEKEYILYTQNEFLGDIYTLDEMRFYLAGQNDARMNYNPWPTLVTGFVLCGTIACIGGDGVITSVGPPLAYTLVQLIPKIKIREKTMSHPDYKYNDLYAEGYEPSARSRKIIRGMEGGFAGSMTGVLVWLAFFKK
jgi:hypothetical protein